MLFVRDKGQMCNNLLQYGHVYAWGRENGRQTMSMRFAYKYRWFRICQTPYHNFLTYVLAKMAARLKWIPVVSFGNENCTPEQKAINEEQMRQHRFAVVEGWLARYYDLFLKYRDEICSLFAFLPETEANVRDLMSQSHAEAGLTIGLHIRRGDYKTFRNGAYYFSDQVYINYLRETLRQYNATEARVFVCTNDPTLDRQAYQQALPQLHFFFPNGSPDHDLCLLSHCDVLVGTVSTFSLVASMYNDLPLCWIDRAEIPSIGARFHKFDYLFRHILDGTTIQESAYS